MTRNEIPREQWASFLNDFTRRHSDKIVKIEVTDIEDYRVDYAESLPLKEVKVFPQNNNNTVVSVTAGASNSFFHTVDDPEMITLEEREERAKTLIINSSSGRSVVIRFHPLDENDDLM